MRHPQVHVIDGASGSMPWRLKRFVGQGELHFVTFSCYQRRPFLNLSGAKDLFVAILGEVREEFRFRLAGYVVMPEHVHLLFEEIATASPAKILQVLKQRLSRALRGGHWKLAAKWPQFWQRRYYDLNVHSEEKVREKLDYMRFNPVKRGLVQHPRDWKWSSFQFYESGVGPLSMDPWEKVEL